jgi:hypothetical protein
MFGRRKRRRHHHHEPWKQFDSAAERKRVLTQLEALALQGEHFWQLGLELVPFEAIGNDNHPFWSDEPRVLAVKCLLEIDVLSVLNERRMKS